MFWDFFSSITGGEEPANQQSGSLTFADKELIHRLLNDPRPTDMQYLLFYLHKVRLDADLLLQLTQRLYGMNSADVCFFMPEIVYLALLRQFQPFAKVLLDRAQLSLSDFWLVYWTTQAFGFEIKDKLPNGRTRLDGLERELCMSMSGSPQDIEMVGQAPSAYYFQQLQQARVSNYTYCSKFVNKLVKMSLDLKQQAEDQRKTKLKAQISEANRSLRIRASRQQNKGIGYHEGIIIPFRKEAASPYDSSLVVAIVEGECSCYNTKKRVPYRIVFETIDMKDIRSCQPQSKAEYQCNDTFLQDAPEKLQAHPSEKDQSKHQRLEQFVNSLKEQDKGSNQQTGQQWDSSPIPFASSIQQTPPQYRDQSPYDVEESFELETQEVPIKTFGPWQQLWSDKSRRFAMKSDYSHFPSYKLRNCIVKGGDDLRQEAVCMQLICKFQQILREADQNLYLRPYEIIILSESSGLMEFVTDSLSIDALKKSVKNFKSLHQFYRETFGEHFVDAQRNFMYSLAAYALVTYLLQIKDRHNGNILIDCWGHIIHIDYGFAFSNSPGGLGFESSPFKLTSEYIELLQGKNSSLFEEFRRLLKRGFLKLREQAERICLIVAIMSEQSDLLCFKSFKMSDFRERFKEKLSVGELQDHCDQLIEESCQNWRSEKYDLFQYLTNGISR